MTDHAPVFTALRQEEGVVRCQNEARFKHEDLRAVLSGAGASD